nr:PREDICTED: tRNA pseudouridine(38/39) synthase isoform X1 [Daucus carota subsp. sativus]
MAEQEEHQDLLSQLQFLQTKLKELETENAKLSSLLSNCPCHKLEQNADSNGQERIDLVNETKRVSLGSGVKIKKKNSKHGDGGSCTQAVFQFSRRYIALKVMYFGQRFYGFGSEAQMDPTVESELFKALLETRLVFGDKKSWQYSRCGRTDKGVSSIGQVVALYLRSRYKVKGGSTEQFVTEDLCEGELNYVHMLNKVLPKDIRVMGWCPVPVDFSARFSCRSREYKYFFWKANLNTVAMDSASKKLVGEHDFRNFCKMDAANVHNFRRHITLFEICPFGERFQDDELWSIRIKGSAFLWHQVRCMVAVLFMIGEGLESPDVLDVLLDVDKISRKPQYNMAPEMPLVLQTCEFEGLKFKCTRDDRQALQLHFQKECRSHKLQAAIFHEALRSCSLAEIDDSRSSSPVKKKAVIHIPLLSRPTEPSYEERRSSKLQRAQQEKVDELVRE